MIDLNCISYWHPILADTGVAVPKTEIIHCPEYLGGILEGEKPACFDVFISELKAAAARMGYPCFLRSGHTSGKHGFIDTCCVQLPTKMAFHVARIVEYGECVSIVGLPTAVWAVRKWLNLHSSFKAFKGLPINKERRYFIGGGRVICHHPYWPKSAIEEELGLPGDWQDRLALLNKEDPPEVELLTQMSETVSRSFDGEWSLDWAMDIDGKWWAIDMAEAKRSYHWPDCKNVPDRR